jgi:excisionase family DNA binding protein
MELCFINQSIAANLISTAKSIQSDPNLEANDMPVLASLVNGLDSALRAKTAALYNQSVKPQIPAEEQESDGFLTVKQAAKKLQLSKGYLYRLIRQGKFPAKPSGKRGYRIRKSDVDSWSYEGTQREPTHRIQSSAKGLQHVASSNHDSTEPYEARIRGPRERQSVNQTSIQ